jgi:hypothetical protein
MSARRSTSSKSKAKHSNKQQARRHKAKKAAKRHAAAAPVPEPPLASPDSEPLDDIEDAAMLNDDPATRYDPRLDRRIIEGMLHDRKSLMDDLAEEGIKAAVVMRRAADLGLSEAYIRQVQGVAADLAGERPGHKRTPTTLGARTCLSCDRVFLSAGPGNRLCMRCRGGDAGLAQL